MKLNDKILSRIFFFLSFKQVTNVRYNFPKYDLSIITFFITLNFYFEHPSSFGRINMILFSFENVQFPIDDQCMNILQKINQIIQLTQKLMSSDRIHEEGSHGQLCSPTQTTCPSSDNKRGEISKSYKKYIYSK